MRSMQMGSMQVGSMGLGLHKDAQRGGMGAAEGCVRGEQKGA